jgi:hypothetical protein
MRIALNSYGVSVAVECDDTGLVSAIQSSMPRSATEWQDTSYTYLIKTQTNGDRSWYEIYDNSNSRLVTRLYDPSEVLHTICGLMGMTIATRSFRKLFLHAGVVCWKGASIIIPGPSFSGKTTLVDALVKAGATYYSDEYAVVDGYGFVYPYSRPLFLRDRDNKIRVKSIVEGLRERCRGRPVPVALVLITQYLPNACWSPVRLSPGESMIELLRQTVVARYRPDIVLPYLREVALQAKTIKTFRGEAATVSRQILSEVSYETQQES